MSCIFIIPIVIYCVVLIFAIFHWNRITAQSLPIESKAASFITIIIPVRNEVLNIGKLLTSIGQQNFNQTFFEVIVVDDHSEDDTAKIVKDMVLPYRLKVISLSNILDVSGKKPAGKKQAITQGILEAKNGIIITTDADCFMGREWLKSMQLYFEILKAKMVVGAVAFQNEENSFQKMQTLEFAALVGSGAVSLQLGKPNMCNGANLAFSRAAFLEVNGYQGNEHIPSGDDEFLLQKIYQRYPNDVFFNASTEGVVYTSAIKEFRTFVNQRRRWSGKWKSHKSWSVKMLAVGIFVFHLVMIVSFLAVLAGGLSPLVYLSGFMFKATIEYIYLKRILNNFVKIVHFKEFLILQSIYSIYVLVFGVMANFGTFDWKGRKYK